MVQPLKVLSLGMFSDPQTVADLNSGRSWLSIKQLGGLSDILAVPILPTLLNIFVRPNYNVPDWLPVLPFSLENPVDPTSWIGQKGRRPLDPRDDPFYHPSPSTYTNKKNGEVIAIREVGLSKIWINVRNAYQISYRTQGTFGDAQADVTTVMIPNNPTGKVVSYQMWQDATSLQCCPSYSIVTGISDPTLDILLLLGFVINFPDHQGVKSSFACGIKEGQSTLDSLKAYLSSREKLGLDKTKFNKIVMWGYSGGSIATGHAIESLPTYAPDLQSNVVGAICGGYVTNLTSIVEMINGGIFAGFAAAGIWGLGTEYPKVQNVIDTRIRPGIRWRFNYVGKRCLIANIINFLFQNVWSYTDDKSGNIIHDPAVVETIEKEYLGVHSSPSVPMFIYNGVQDEIASVVEVDRTVDHYCKQGVKVDYARLGALAHISTEVVAILDCLKYMYKFFDGYVPASCSDYKQATKQTTTYYQSHMDQFNNIVNCNWKQSGLLDQLKKEGYIN